MALEAGTQLGSFEITGRIGAGGMGEVYRATDTKLGRDVAIKTLPASLADDKDRLARFEREAKLLASLNHAHIASVYNLDEHDGTLYIAMELVEGETLEERLKKGALPVDEALQLGLQIALALEAAHEKGVVHRDLKPANIMITPDGVVKVLDFGLAKAFSGDPDEASPNQSPALSVAMTQQGLILGTAGYMSPEQASGQATDQRADIWSFGVVLYEMLTGMPVFSGESVPHVLADVLKTEPDWDRLPKGLHWRVRQTLERCLTKKPRNRLHWIADARIEIEAAVNDPGAMPAGRLTETRSAPSRRVVLAAGSGLVLSGVALRHVAGWFLESSPEPTRLNRFIHTLPDDQRLSNQRLSALHPIAISADGTALLYTTGEAIYRRSMDQVEAQNVGGSQFSDTFITGLFYLSDSGSVVISSRDLPGEDGFFRASGPGRLLLFPLGGGASQPISEIGGVLQGLSNGPDGTILYSITNWDSDSESYSGGIYTVRIPGGSPQPKVLANETEVYKRPQLLPDGESVLVSLTTEAVPFLPNIDELTEVVVVSLETGQREKTLIPGGGNAVYVPTGHIVYVIGNELWGVAFDHETLTIGEDHILLEQRVNRPGPASATSSFAQFTVGEDGTLAYVEGSQSFSSGRSEIALQPEPLAWIDRDGTESVIAATTNRVIDDAHLSPDGTLLVIEVERPTGQPDLTPYDLVYRLWIAGNAESPVPLLVHAGSASEVIARPFWIDNDRVVGSIARTTLAFVDVNQTRPPETLSIPNATGTLTVTGLTPDRSHMLVSYGERTFAARTAGRRVGLVPILPDDNDEHPIEPLIDREAENAQIAPEIGDLIIYESDQSGSPTIYIDHYPDFQRPEPITDDGAGPIWSQSGDTVFYTRASDRALMRVTIDRTPELVIGEPEVISPNIGYSSIRAVASDDRLLVQKRTQTASDVTTERMIVVQGFAEELKRLLPSV